MQKKCNFILQEQRNKGLDNGALERHIERIKSFKYHVMSIYPISKRLYWSFNAKRHAHRPEFSPFFSLL